MKFALVGNQNCGKTTLFNQLTGANQHVGNFPGVTVDSKSGVVKKHDDCVIVDLPGIYSLRPYTTEEIVTRDFILNEKPDGIINIVDATTIERNLYLTTQLMTMDIPMVIALNMMDEVRGNGGTVDIQKMSDMMGCPVVPISAAKNEGVDELIDVVIKTAKEQIKPKVKDICESDSPVHRCLHSAIHLIEDHAKSAGISGRFAAMNLITTGGDFDKRLNLDENEKELLEHSVVEMENDTGLDRDAAMASMTYDFIEKVSRECVVKPHESKERLKSEKIDKVLTNKYGAIPLFILIMAAIYLLTFQVIGKYIGLGIEMGIDALDKVVVKGLTKFGTNPAIIDFLDKGLFGGLGAVVSLLPYIVVMFMFLSLLEDSGYMARVAFILDRIFRRFGLSGRAFMPMIMGFGCSVPAFINTRTLADEKERVATIRVIPFFSCGAKLPILTAIAGGIATMTGLKNPDVITYCMYILGVVVAIACVLLMRATTMKGDVPPFIMELPAYHAPQPKNLMLHLWDKTKHFVKKAFTIILASTIVIWFMSHFSWNWNYLEDTQMNQSILAGIGGIIRPLFTPLGFGSQLANSFGWVFAVAAITGLIAKENVIATFGTLAACIVGGMIDVEADGGLMAVAEMIRATGIGVPGLIAFIAFNMLTIPCFAAVATAKAELPSKKSFRNTLLFWIGTSYIVAMMIYLIGSWWWTVFIFAAIWAAIITLIVLDNKGKIDVNGFFKNLKGKMRKAKE